MEDENITTTNIYIKDDKIYKIGYLDDFTADKIIDGEGYITMPGLINAHTHVAMTLFRNYGPETDLMTWLNLSLIHI